MNERLTEPERAFAEQRHNLIYSFLNSNSLPVNEFYDVVAFGYLRETVPQGKETAEVQL